MKSSEIVWYALWPEGPFRTRIVHWVVHDPLHAFTLQLLLPRACYKPALYFWRDALDIKKSKKKNKNKKNDIEYGIPRNRPCTVCFINEKESSGTRDGISLLLVESGAIATRPRRGKESEKQRTNGPSSSSWIINAGIHGRCASSYARYHELSRRLRIFHYI